MHGLNIKICINKVDWLSLDNAIHISHTYTVPHKFGTFDNKFIKTFINEQQRARSEHRWKQ